MQDPELKKLIDERSALLAELAELRHMLHGSWVERYLTCVRPECRCHTGERHGPRYYVVVNEGGRQKQKYVPQSQVEAAREGITQHKRLLLIVERITQINIMLMRKEALDER